MRDNKLSSEFCLVVNRNKPLLSNFSQSFRTSETESRSQVLANREKGLTVCTLFDYVSIFLPMHYGKGNPLIIALFSHSILDIVRR